MNFKIILNNNNNKNNEEVKINRARIAKDYKRDNKFRVSSSLTVPSSSAPTFFQKRNVWERGKHCRVSLNETSKISIYIMSCFDIRPKIFLVRYFQSFSFSQFSAILAPS